MPPRASWLASATSSFANEDVVLGTGTCKNMKFHAVHRDGMVLSVSASTATVLLKGRPSGATAAPERGLWDRAVKALTVAASKQRKEKAPPSAVQQSQQQWAQWGPVLAETETPHSDEDSDEESDDAVLSDGTSATPPATARSSSGAAPHQVQAAPAPSDILSQTAARPTPAELQAAAKVTALSEQLAAALERITLMEAKLQQAPAPAEETAPAAAQTARAAQCRRRCGRTGPS